MGADGTPGACCRVGPGSEVYDCAVRQCAGATISVGAGSCIESCCCVGGSGGAYRCADGCCVMDCDVIQHDGMGMECASRCSVTDCRCVMCWGMSCASECVVCSNEVSSCTSPPGGVARAIYLFGGQCCVEDNSISNCPLGIYVDAGGNGSLIESNVIYGGGGGGGGAGGAIYIDPSVTRCMCLCNCAPGWPAGTAFSMGSSSHGPIADCPPGDISAVAGSSHPWSNVTC
jgi:parallel beta-helix repeat protein